jgi:integrase
MVRILERPLVKPSVARAAVEETRDDPLLYAGVSLMLLAGLRPSEVTSLLVRDWSPGDDPQLTVGGVRRPRTIRVAQSAADRIEDYLGDEETAPEEPLLLGLKTQGIPHMVHRVFQDRMQQAQLGVDAHDLRRAAIATVLEDGAPMQHVEAYFGISKTDLVGKQLVPLRDGYDRGIAAVLEETFAGRL